uniref:Uncharacterized protein n=1 Tax=Anguilla anguilla TaxID=7936 RepID=A0A0E9PLW8_ANGAN
MPKALCHMSRNLDMWQCERPLH